MCANANRNGTPKDVPIVVVEWRDARFYQQMRSADSISECRMATFASVGYLVSRDEVTTTLAAEYNDENEYRDITLIPSGSIVTIRRLAIGSLM